MLKENWNKNEKLKYSDFKVIITIIKYLCSIYNIEESLSNNILGDFLYAEKLQNIEDLISEISEISTTNFTKKKWHNMTVIDYTDINRWSKVLNIISNMQTGGNTLITEEGNTLITEEGNIFITEILEV
jgi:hypothetical protein